ncbi:MAG: radical SAM protein [Proteobacteria bacterium]|nr:radical SAM protein [Pseudomonadota bacterium]
MTKAIKIHEVEAKSILTKSNLPDADFVINPYTGCAFACSYCYASFMSRFIDESPDNWGKYVYVKTNAVELLDKKLYSMRKKDGTIFIASVTDAWQPIEKRYKLTRGLLKVLVKHDYQGRVSCLTKSPLIVRDIDLLKQLANAEVGLTITSTDNKVLRTLEAVAPSSEKRLAALKELNKAGLKTYAFIGPVFPYFMNHKNKLENIFKEIKNAGTNSIYIETLNTAKYINSKLNSVIANESEEMKQAYLSIKNDDKTAKELEIFLYEMVTKYNFELKCGEIISHL